MFEKHSLLTLRRNPDSQQSQEQVSKRYEVLECKQMNGQFGVYDVADLDSNQTLTLKAIIKNQSLSKDKAINEIKNHQLFSGRSNFINLLDIFEDSENIYLVMEKWGPTLEDLMEKRLTLTEYETQLIFSQLIDIVSELRTKNVSHNNLTLSSIHVDLNHNHKVKVGDFSFSFSVKEYFEGIVEQDTHMRQSPEEIEATFRNSEGITVSNQHLKKDKEKDERLTMYSSPEEFRVSNQNEYSRISVLYENDIWSIGVILYRLVIGRFPFQHPPGPRSEEHRWMEPTIEMIKSCSYNFQASNEQIYQEPLSSQFKELIKSFLQPEYRRIKLKDLISHPMKLLNYGGGAGINFMSTIVPLLESYQSVWNVLKPIRQDLEDYARSESDSQNRVSALSASEKSGESRDPSSIYQTPKQRQSHTEEFIRNKQSKKYILTSDENQSLFQLFQSSNPSKGARRNQVEGFNPELYASTWKINFESSADLRPDDSLCDLPNCDSGRQIDKENEQRLKEFQRRIQNCPIKPENALISPTKKNKKISFYDSNASATADKFEKNKIERSSESRFSTRLGRNTSSLKLSGLRKQDVKGNGIKFNIRSIQSKKVLSNGNPLAGKAMTFHSSDSKENDSNGKDPFNQKEYSLSKVNEELESDNMNETLSIDKQPSSYEVNETNRAKPSLESGSVQVHVKGSEECLYDSEERCSELIIKNRISKFPLIVEEPFFVLKYRKKKHETGQHSLGYVLNNSIGVIFSEGTQVIGHSHTDYRILKSKNGTSETQQKLSGKQMEMYQQYLRFFGSRMVMSNFSIWIEKFWSEGCLYVFLLSNGSWQVTFEDKKTSRFYVVDENDLIWSKGAFNLEVVNIVRAIVQSKKKEILH